MSKQSRFTRFGWQYHAHARSRNFEAVGQGLFFILHRFHIDLVRVDGFFLTLSAAELVSLPGIWFRTCSYAGPPSLHGLAGQPVLMDILGRGCFT